MSLAARIAILGPESTGKSTLCEELAEHYRTLWVPEYARAYLSDSGKVHSAQEIEDIYRVQFEQECGMLPNAHRCLFTDTEFIIGKVWCEHVFGSTPVWFDEMNRKHHYDLYLMTMPDLPWEPDPLRENPGKGEYFFEWYKRILEELDLPYRVVQGIGEVRLNGAVGCVDAYLKG